MSHPHASLALDAQTIVDLDLGGIKLIEASAGTGKTHTIADLYLRHVLAGRSPAQILLVTFTNAATEELRGRIRQRLYLAARVLGGQQAADGGLLPLLLQQAGERNGTGPWLQRIEVALATMDEAAISTIHGFCQRALRQYALTSGQFIDASLQADDKALWEAATRDWWRTTTYGLDAELWALVNAQLPGLQPLLRTLLDLRNKPTAIRLPESHEDLPTLYRQPARIAAGLQALGPTWFEHRHELADILTSKVLSQSQKLPYFKGNLPRFLTAADLFFGTTTPSMPFADFEYLGRDSLHHFSKPSQRGKDPRFEHEFFTALDPIVRDWQQFKGRLRSALMIDAHRSVAERVAEQKRLAMLLAYQDQLVGLRDALRSADGAYLAARLRQQYPVAMIDEFQDTDAIQFDIFSRIYLGSDDDNDASLTLIGDPKQAIYSFRGGDIFTYIDARSAPGVECFHLDTNWRSSPGLVDAVNRLFGHRRAPFIHDRAIRFQPVGSRPDNQALGLSVEGQPVTPLTLWRLPPGDDGKPLSRDAMRERIYSAVAAEIVELLNRDSRIAEQPLAHGDIAILVRSASEGERLAAVLQQQGIASVTISRESVYASDEARGLYELLRGITRYQDIDAARRALASGLLLHDSTQIAAIVDDDRRWQAWVEDLAELNLAWQRQGFIAMFQRLLRRFDIARRLAGQRLCERRLTNLLHLGELLQRQSTVLSGADRLLGWFAQQFDAEALDESELRLEGDESLVKIVTIHKSKGLQYPVVFAPFLWYCKTADSKKPAVFFHRDDHTACIDFGSDSIEQHARLAEKERLGEDLRLLYVALTRAQSKVYLAWGLAGTPGKPGYANQTALAYLLHSTQQPADLDHGRIDGFPDTLDLDAELADLASGSDGRIGIEPLPAPAPAARVCDAGQVDPPMALAAFGRERLPTWKIASFTGLTRGMHRSSAGHGAVDDDPILEFPAGSQVGLMLHALFEHIDFRGDIDAQCANLLPRFLPGAGLDLQRHGDLVTTWLRQVLDTPLDTGGLRLADLPNRRRLNELEFDFALDRFDSDALNDLLQAHAGCRLPPIQEGAFEGLVNGVIDLVFEHDGRYFLADYKSNRLGGAIADYREAALGQAMLDGRYDLQSLLYVLALHRYLSGRIADYDYRKHFGGSFYLFLRGMRPALGATHGVYFERPPPETIDALQRVFRFTPSAVTS